MTTARDRMLAAVGNALIRAELPDATRERLTQDTLRGADRVQALVENRLEALVEGFERGLTSLTGQVHRADSLQGIADAIAGIADSYGSKSYLGWNDEAIGCPGLNDALASRGLARVTYDLPFDAPGRDSGVRTLEDVGLGVTGADAALADCGGIVVTSGPGRGRLVSLLPPVHVAVVRTSTLYPSLPALLAMRPDLVARGSNFVVIAGPSRTADIEMTLTHGVHGPKHVHAILIP